MNLKLDVDFKPYFETHEKTSDDWIRDHWIFRFGKVGLSVICHLRKGRYATYGSSGAPFETCLVEFDENECFALVEEPKGWKTDKDVNDMLHKLEVENADK